MDQDAWIRANKALWNERTTHHVGSGFYDVEDFVAGADPLNAIELALLGAVKGKRLLHLQCHFGMDTIALARRGAIVTGLDLSDRSVAAARDLATRCGVQAEFIEGNVLVRNDALAGRFDIVFTSYGTIGWLPDLKSWAANIAAYLVPGGSFVMAEFHPVLWMWDNDFGQIAYSYFNRSVIEENETGTYADRNAPVDLPSYSWNHPLADVLGSLIGAGLRIETVEEFDRSPYDCFRNCVPAGDGNFFIRGFEGKMPMVYAIKAIKPG